MKLNERKIFASLPAWFKREYAKVPHKPQEFIPNRPPVYPQGMTTRAIPVVLDCPQYGENMTPAEYVAHFDKLNNLKPTSILWVTPTLGNFG